MAQLQRARPGHRCSTSSSATRSHIRGSRRPSAFSVLIRPRASALLAEQEQRPGQRHPRVDERPGRRRPGRAGTRWPPRPGRRRAATAPRPGGTPRRGASIRSGCPSRPAWLICCAAASVIAAERGIELDRVKFFAAQHRPRSQNVPTQGLGIATPGDTPSDGTDSVVSTVIGGTVPARPRNPGAGHAGPHRAAANRSAAPNPWSSLRLEVGRHPRLAGEHRLQPQRRGVPGHRLAEAEALGVRRLDRVGQRHRDRLRHRPGAAWLRVRELVGPGAERRPEAPALLRPLPWLRPLPGAWPGPKPPGWFRPPPCWAAPPPAPSGPEPPPMAPVCPGGWPPGWPWPMGGGAIPWEGIPPWPIAEL